MTVTGRGRRKSCLEAPSERSARQVLRNSRQAPQPRDSSAAREQGPRDTQVGGRHFFVGVQSVMSWGHREGLSLSPPACQCGLLGGWGAGLAGTEVRCVPPPPCHGLRNQPTKAAPGGGKGSKGRAVKAQRLQPPRQ